MQGANRVALYSAIRGTEAFIPQLGKGSGWLPEPEDTRDYKLKMLLGTPGVPPTKTDQSDQSPVRDQGQYGVCTGFALASGVENLVRKPTDDFFETLYSPAFAYWHGRLAIGETLEDNGAYIRDVVHAAANIGVARERDWMYYELQKNLFIEPDAKAFKSAESWKLGAYYRCGSLTDVRLALAAGYPVVGGFICFQNLNQAWQTGIVPMPAGQMVGGHAIHFVGYDDAARLVKFKNSWGSYWGDDGYGYLPYDYFLQGLVDDMWALQGEAESTRPKTRVKR